MYHPSRLIYLGLILALFALASCTTAPPESGVPSTELTAPPTKETVSILKVMTHDSFDMSEEVLRQFETANHASVQFIKSGDTGTALNKAILSRDNPLADVFYGVDNTFLSRALNEDIFERYDSPLLADIPDEFKLDPESRALPVDYGDVCLNYDRAYFAQHDLPVPQVLDDLLQPRYKSLLVVQNPALSSPGLAFLLATIGNYGSQGYLEYWQQLVANDVLVVNDWETAYYSEFSGSSGKGPRPIVVSYNSSPVFEVIYSEEPVDEPPTAAITSDKTCFRQIEFVGLLKGARNRELGRQWIDFMLSRTFQEDLPLKMFVFPVNPQAVLDEVFVKYLSVPEQTAFVSPDEIAANREAWIKAWTELVLR